MSYVEMREFTQFKLQFLIKKDNRVDPYYLKIPYSPIHPLIKIYVVPQINTCGTLGVKDMCSKHMFPAEGEQGHTQPSLSSSPTINKCPFHSLFRAIFSKCLFFLLILLFNMAPEVVLKCYLVLLSTRTLWCAWQSKLVC